MRSNVCIVGNSPNVQSREDGCLIDSCDIVIRMNTFITKGYEKYVGSKTDIISLSFCNLEDTRAAIAGYGIKDFSDISFWSTRFLVDNRLNICKKILSEIGVDTVTQPTTTLWKHLVDKIYEDFWRKQPSSGIVTLQMALDLFGKDNCIFYCGFDDTIEKAHLGRDLVDYTLPGEPGSGHDWIGEWKYLNKMVKHVSVLEE